MLLDSSNGSSRSPGFEGYQALDTLDKQGITDTIREDTAEIPCPPQFVDNEFDIPTDAYGSAILAIVKDSPMVFCGSCSGIVVVRLIFALLLLALNLALQWSILYFINVQVVNHSVRHVQEVYRDFHRSSFDLDGRFRRDLWAAETEKGELCQIAMTNRMFYYCTLFLWTVSMLGEFRLTQRQITQIWSVPVCPHSGDMIEVGENGSCIRRLTRPVRYALLSIVCLPKLLIASTLLGVGWRWLSATTSFEALVMNSVAMEFVTRIDDMLYDFAVPESYKKEVADINFNLRTPVKTDAQKLCDEWKSFVRSVSYLSFALVLILFYALYIQDVLPPGIHDVKEHCSAWLEVEGTPICHGFWESLTTGKSYESCYPYGAEH